MNKKDSYTETLASWDKVAKKYQEAFMDINIYNDSYNRFCNQLTKSKSSILEIGCGPGNITKRLLDRKQSLQILATDVSNNMIQLAQVNNPDATCRQIDARNISELDQKFDGIIAGFILPYLLDNDGDQFVKNCAQLLNPKGVFYLSFVAGDSSKSSFIKGSTGDQMFFSYYTKETIITRLENYGFTIVEEIEVTYSKNENRTEIHSIFIAQKV